MNYRVDVCKSVPGGCWMMSKDVANDLIKDLPTTKCVGVEDWYVIEQVQKTTKRFLVVEGLVRHVGFGYSLWLDEQRVYQEYERHFRDVFSRYGWIMDADGKDVEKSDLVKKWGV